MVGMMTREVLSPPFPLQLTTNRPVTANSQLRSSVRAVNRMCRRLKRNTEKHAAEESECIQGCVKGVDSWKLFP